MLKLKFSGSCGIILVSVNKGTEGCSNSSATRVWVGVLFSDAGNGTVGALDNYLGVC